MGSMGQSRDRPPAENDEKGNGTCCSCDCRWRRSPPPCQRSTKRRREEMEVLQLEGAARVEVENEVAALREALASHQQTVAELYMELEEERAAAASATDEAMSMILRLQREKAEAQMEARQFRRFVEEKMSHDQQELGALEDALFIRERAVQVLSGEVHAYRRRLFRLGIDLSSPDPDDGSDGGSETVILPDDLDYPRLRCCYDRHDLVNGEIDDVLEMYPGSAHEHLQNLERRMDDLERVQEMEKGVVEAHPPAAVECSYFSGKEDDGAGDRVYTVDAVHGVSPPATEPVDIKKLYTRLEALEADRESMRQAIVSMRTEKAQLFLLKEIAQNMYQDAFSPAPPYPPRERTLATRQSTLGCSLFASMAKRILSFVLWRMKARRNKRLFGIRASSSAGLSLLLEKSSPGHRHHLRQQRCFSRTDR